MKLTQFTDFGLRALMVLAENPDQSLNSKELARILDISREHLIKVLQRLAAGGYVQNQRGANGGVRLDKDASEILLGNVVRWLEDGQGLVECLRPDGGHCNLTPLCLLRPLLSDAAEAFYARLNTSTLADCLHPPLQHFITLQTRKTEMIHLKPD
ncbi:HTH-type transcriptional regulator NsrR [Thiomonas arsenitoxydans]|uniref:Transcriptional regulator n=1 Tax=Thiomonas arsenitoxydans (strain DSM 22701 / CIP 110005 / 3As) TaxID=426114 RepID=D6CTA2_THIA3|nr:Rrf2 family transcriptional regulator [Thiomonas arsenitoxydans]MBN8776719.1 Rrf2 family transcriptional regulator [Thiomonas arsenitoxydans]CAZ88521.1 putative Transcriptional regulator [Thiomonas arsenitoxydans]CQR32464.1 HTH-type transcriptional regulator NsrR [Thiomonas arsenitoxydans]CQR34351.1 HTH-type transcriptional regulator NsrR [Thiomonas arsenitoxydans]CQR34431.1 HTH-type transcriptional regulator NsrR [Thiomonas arsenitoxydans]